MKRIGIIITLISALAMMMGCSGNDDKSGILVSSEASDCKDSPAWVLNTATGETEIDEYVKYEATSDGYLLIQHINAQHGCESNIAISASASDNVITIAENGNQSTNCICSYDLSMKIGPLKTGRYEIVIYKNSLKYTSLSIDLNASLKGEYHL